MKIIGAGLAGLLCGNMLARHNPVIYESQPSLPNNHSAVLRFRTSTVGDVLGIPFKKVTMIKATSPWKNPVADSLSYSHKCTGVWKSDRSIIGGTTVAERFIAPANLVKQMSQGLDIQYDTSWTSKIGEPVISTMPMPALMKLLKYENEAIKFEHSEGINIRAHINGCDAYVSLYIPGPEKFSRISITGHELIIELPNLRAQDIDIDEILFWACDAHLGIDVKQIYQVELHKQRYSKILPINDEARKEFLHHATVKYNIYSLGRFACWRPGLLLDDLVPDIRKIEGWIKSGNKYEMARDR